MTENEQKLVNALKSLLDMPGCCNTDPEIKENVDRRYKARKLLDEFEASSSPEKLSPYNLALTWSEAHMAAERAEKATLGQDHAMAQTALDEMQKRLDKIHAHHRLTFVEKQ